MYMCMYVDIRVCLLVSTLWLLAFVSASVCQVFNFNCENESEKQNDECN